MVEAEFADAFGKAVETMQKPKGPTPEKAKNTETESQDLKKLKKFKPYDHFAKALFASAPLLAFIIKANVAEAANMSIKEIVRRIRHPAAKRRTGKKCFARTPALLEKNESGWISADCVVTLKLTDDVLIRINIEAQSKANPGYPLGARGVFYCAELLVEQMSMGWLSGSDYSGLSKVYSIWLVSNAPSDLRGRVFSSTMSTSEIFADGSAKPLAKADPGVDKLCVILAYLPNAETPSECASWLADMSVIMNREFR